MSRILTALALGLLTAWSLAPFLWTLGTSLKAPALLTRLPPLLPLAPTTEHYVAVFSGYPFARVILNSVLVAALTTALALALGSAAAFALARLRVRGRTALFAGVIGISMLPPIATVYPLFLVIRTLHLHDTLAGLVLVYATFSLPLAIWLLASFFRQIPDELYDAARLDGCGPFRAFVRVMLPLAAPGVLSTGLLVFIFAWNEFLYALTFTSSDSARTVPVAIALFPGLHAVPWGEIAAASVVVTLPLLAIAFLLQRRMVAGLTAGALKG